MGYFLLNSLPETIGDRIAHYRHRLGISQSQLLYCCGWCKKGEAAIKQGRISHYESGRRTPSNEDIITLAKALGTTPEILTFGGKADNVEPFNLIPVLTLEQLKKTKSNMRSIKPVDITEYHSAPLSGLGANKVFALHVETETMLPEFHPDDIIVIDPDATPRPGDYVMAAFGRGDPVLRQYIKEGRNNMYCTLNEQIPAMIATADNKPRIYGVVISKSRSYK